MTAKFLAHLCLAATAAILASCASPKEAEISKVNYYKLDARKDIISADPAISFEQKHRLYGAVSNEEMNAREGHYYTVHWRVSDRSQPVKVKLEYRQAKTGSKVNVQEVEVPDAGRSNTTEFQVVGEDYKTNGHVTAWKVSLIRGKEEVASHRSYLWE